MMKYLFMVMLTLMAASTLSIAEANFSRFRGENHDGVVAGEKGLMRAWPEEGLKELWRIKLGKGYSSGVIYDEKVYVHDVEKNKDIIRTFDIANGQELWRCAYDSKPHNSQSRANPTVDENHVVSIGSDGTVACVDRKTGKLVWTIDLAKDLGLAITKEAKSSKLAVYGIAQNPLIDGDAVIIACCTPKSLMIKVELATGKILWTTDNPKQWTMTFTSITPMTFQGQKHYVYSTFEGVVGVSATDGKILWEYPEWKAEIWNEKADPPNYLPVIPSPIVVGPDKLFFCAQNVGKLGCLMLQLTQAEGDGIEPRKIFREKDMASGIQTPIYFGGRIYGNGTDDGFICFSLEGKMLWRQKKMGPWPYLIADSMIYILDKAGQLHLLDASVPEFKELAAWQIPFEGPKYYDAASWSPMAMSNGRLILRLGDELVCLLVK